MPPRDDVAAFNEAFGIAVREVRESQDYSQEGFAFEAEIDRTYVSGIERGVRNPTLRTIHRLATALGVKPSSLIRRAEEVLRGK